MTSSLGPPGSLTGRRILELAGPLAQYGGKVLGDLGADVIRIEDPAGDYARSMPPFVGPGGKRATSIYYEAWNLNKRSVSLNLGTKDGKRLFERLVQSADAVIESRPPGTLVKHGYSYERLAKINPRIIVTTVTGFGTEGPYKDYIGSNLVYYALSGFMASSGEPERPPVVIGGQLTYVCSSIHAAAGTLLAILGRDTHGIGQHVEVSAHQAMVAFTTIAGVTLYLDTGKSPTRRGNHGLYPCKDGYIIIAIGRPEQWRVFSKWVAEVTGNKDILDPKLQGRPDEREPYADLVSMYITEFSMSFEREELYKEGQRRHLTLGPVYTIRDLLTNPQMVARGLFQEQQHPKLGNVKLAGAPYKFSKTSTAVRRVAPDPGQDNQAVLCDELGLSKKELSALKAAGAV
jgi:crotonobetainyl-CoA:carnitine CoA-transferase CaiB-like acyl-CoA transferase